LYNLPLYLIDVSALPRKTGNDTHSSYSLKRRGSFYKTVYISGKDTAIGLVRQSVRMEKAACQQPPFLNCKIPRSLPVSAEDNTKLSDFQLIGLIISRTLYLKCARETLYTSAYCFQTIRSVQTTLERFAEPFDP